MAEKLKVEYLVEGSVQRIGDEAIIYAQLFYANIDKHLWSRRYERNLKDIFEIQAEITQSIASELQAIISPKVQEQIEEVATANSLAYDFFLQGREFLVQFKNTQVEGFLQNAERLFQSALEQDSSLAQAYVGLAEVHFHQNKWSKVKTENFLDIVSILCEKAIKMNANLADAYWLRGAYNHSKYNYNQAPKYMTKNGSRAKFSVCRG